MCPVRFAPAHVAKVGLEPTTVGLVGFSVVPEMPFPDHVAGVSSFVHVLRKELWSVVNQFVSNKSVDKNGGWNGGNERQVA